MTESTHNCPFCVPSVESKVIERLGTVIAIEDKHPVTKGHVLVLPVRHTPSYFFMTSEEKNDADKLIQILCS